MSQASELLERAFNEATVAVDIHDVAPHPKNARQGDVGAITSSLTELGQYRPIVVQSSTNYIVAGNHTWKAAKALGWKRIGATFIDVDDDTALRIMIADNRTAELATNDEDALAALLVELSSTPTGLGGTGYDGDDLEELISSLDPVIDGDERYTPEWLFEAMDVEFDVDLAAPPGGIPYIPAKSYYTQKDDALSQDWTGKFAWCNPPYSIAAKFGEKWNEEIRDGVWLGPLSHSTAYRVRLFETAALIWFPNEMEFEYRTKMEGIAFPVFLGGFGPQGSAALKSLLKTYPERGVALKRVKQ